MAKRPAIAAPVFDRIPLENLTQGDEYDLEPRADLEGVELADLTLDSLDLEAARIDGCRLRGMRSPTADTRSATFTETHLDAIDIPVVRGVRGRWRDVEIRSSRLGSAELYESEWQGVHFIGCRLGFVNLRGSRLRDVAFTDCTIDELDLGRADVTRLAFDGTRVARLDVQSATLAHADLRGAELEEIGGIASLGGAAISPAQLQLLAPLLAAERGIAIAD